MQRTRYNLGNVKLGQCNMMKHCLFWRTSIADTYWQSFDKRAFEACRCSSSCKIASKNVRSVYVSGMSMCIILRIIQPVLIHNIIQYVLIHNTAGSWLYCPTLPWGGWGWLWGSHTPTYLCVYRSGALTHSLSPTLKWVGVVCIYGTAPLPA